MPNYNEIKLKIDSGEYTVVQRNGNRLLYDIFYDIKDSKGEFVQYVTHCTLCRNVYTANPTCTANLLRHSCYKKYKVTKQGHVVKQQPTNECTTKCKELVVQWIVGNCRPCNIGNDEGLYKLVEFFINSGHVYGPNLDVENLIPQSSMVTRNIARLYEDQREILKREFYAIKDNGFGITCDVWSDNRAQTSYMGATVHYIKAGSVVHKLLGMRELSNHPNTGSNNIRNAIADILKDFDCELNQMVTLVTNEGSIMRDAFQHEKRITCINHLLNRVLEGGVSDTAEVNSIATTCFWLVNYLRKSGVNSVLNNTLESCTATRWNKLFHLLQSVQENWDDINQTLQDKNMTSIIAKLNLADIIGTLDVLKPFEKASRILGNENYATIHQVYPQILKLKTVTRKSYPNEPEIIRKFKEKLLIHMETVIEPSIHDLHKISVFLFPPANKLQNFEENEKRSIHEKCKQMLMVYKNDSCDAVMPVKTESGHIDADVFHDFVLPSVSPDFEDEITSEICKYEKQTVAYFKQFDPLKWWHMHKREFPLLYKLCSFVLAIPASSLLYERLFCKAPQLLSESEHDRNPIDVNQIMFLHNNLYRARQQSGIDIKSHNSDSDSDNGICSASKIRKGMTSTPD